MHIPDDILDLVEEITAEAEQLWFANHNDAYPEDWYTLATLLATPELAGNNCHAVAFEVWRAVVEEIGYLGNTSTIQLVFDTSAHWALVIDYAWVLDFTAAQFDTGLPTPWVVPVQQWQEQVAALVWEKHKERLVDVRRA